MSMRCPRTEEARRHVESMRTDGTYRIEFLVSRMRELEEECIRMHEALRELSTTAFPSGYTEKGRFFMDVVREGIAYYDQANVKRDLTAARDLVREYDIVMGDPWRNDGADDCEAADSARLENLVEQVMPLLRTNSFSEAETFIEANRVRVPWGP